MPELAELCAPVIHEDAVLIDAEIEVQWCRDHLLKAPHREAELRARLGRMPRRIDKTAAKTERGRAIKAALGFVA